MSVLFYYLLLLIIFLLALKNTFQLYKQQSMVNNLREQTLELSANLKPDAFSDLELSHFEPEMQLTVRVTDPIALAKREHKIARMFAGFLPSVITRKVYEQVRDEVIQGLRENEVDAKVTIEVIALAKVPTSSTPQKKQEEPDQ